MSESPAPEDRWLPPEFRRIAPDFGGGLFRLAEEAEAGGADPVPLTGDAAKVPETLRLPVGLSSVTSSDGSRPHALQTDAPAGIGTAQCGQGVRSAIRNLFAAL